MQNVKIYKYPLLLKGSQTILLPTGAKILTVQEQKEELFLWAMVDTKASFSEKDVRIIGTGMEVDLDTQLGEYLSTIQMSNGFVWHIFIW